MKPLQAALLGAAIGAAIAAAPLAAQSAGAAPAEVLAVVNAVFDGMKRADSAQVRTGFAEGARFAILDTSGAVRYQSPDGWIRAIANSAGRWAEPLYDVQVRVDGTVAQVWAPYTFYLDGNVRHCGTDTIELLRTAKGWKITQLSDTQRRDNCPDPLRKP